MLVPDDDHADAQPDFSIDHRVWKYLHRECATPLCDGRTKHGIFDQELGDALELEQEPVCDQGAGVLDIKNLLHQPSLAQRLVEANS